MPSVSLKVATQKYKKQGAALPGATKCKQGGDVVRAGLEGGSSRASPAAILPVLLATSNKKFTNFLEGVVSEPVFSFVYDHPVGPGPNDPGGRDLAQS